LLDILAKTITRQIDFHKVSLGYFGYNVLVWELVRMIKMMKRNPDELFIVTGDLNCTPDSLEYGMLTKVGNLRDSYLEINGEKGYTSVGDERLDYVLYGKSDYWKVTSSAIVLTGAGNLEFRIPLSKYRRKVSI